MKGCEVEAIESDGFSRTCGSDRNQGVAGPRATWYCKDCVNKLINNWMIMLDTPEFDDDDAGMVRDEMKDYLATQILNNTKEELGFPDKFFCNCGTEISEDTLAYCGMCDECYSQNHGSTSGGKDER